MDSTGSSVSFANHLDSSGVPVDGGRPGASESTNSGQAASTETATSGDGGQQPFNGGNAQALNIPPPVSTAAPVASNGLPPINFDAVPSLRGLLFPSETGEGASIKGLWAMIDSQHGKEGMTSEFEMHFIQGIGKMTMDPVELMSGKYKGWFRLKRLTGNGTDKVEEKNVILNFSKAGEDGYTIKGEGSNRFGAFVLQGTLGVADNSVVMYRQYVVKAGATPKAAGTTAAAYAGAKKAPTPKSAFLPAAAADGVSSPRDGAGRERKKSAVFDETYAHEPKPGAKAKAVAAANPRTQRLSQHLLKCGDLLKEMKKLPASVYFLEPVDPIKLNIPDYHTLVTTPMDFSTIQNKLTAGAYAAPSNFAEDVRLVFKNAITYNQLRDNPVHIAARDMSHKFEEKYKSLHNAMTSKQSVSNAELAAFTSRSSSRPATASKPKSKGGGGSRKSVGGAGGGYGAMGMLPPDGSAIQIQEMHRQMMEMQSELMTLRQSVGQEAIMSAMDRQQEASRKPLTYNEKKDLIDSINRMEEEHMERIVNIIQESRATNGAEGEEDIEVPLDELDTGTLRRLQAVVDEVMPGRKGKRALDEGVKKEAAPVSRPQRQPNPAKKARSDDVGYAHSYNHNAPPPAPQVGTVGPGMVAPSAPAPAAVPTVDGPSEDYGDLFQGGGAGGGPAAVASADAWAASSSSSSQAATAAAAAASAGVGAGGDGTWNDAGAELQARQARDEQLKQEEGRLQQQRQQEESERAQALREAAMLQEQEQRLAQETARAEAAQAERDMQARREEERQQRLAQSGAAAAALDSSALLKQMESDDV